MDEKKKGKKSGALSWLLKNSKGQHGKIVCLVFANALFSVLSVAFAFAVKEVVDGAVYRDRDKLVFGIVFIISIVVLQFVFRLITNGLSEHIKGKLEMGYKSAVFASVLKKKYSEVKKFHSGELMNRLTADVSVIADGVTSIVPSVVSSAVRLVCAVIALVALDWVFAVAFVVAGVLVFATLGILRGKLKSLHKKSLETDGEVRSFMQESLENVLALKVFSVNDKIEKRSDELQSKNFKVKMRRKNYAVFGSATYNLIFSAGYLFALIYGGISIFTGSGLGYGDLSAILQLVNNVQVPFAALSSAFPKYYATIASAERLMELENLEDEPTSSPVDAREFYKGLRSVNISSVDFSYGREQVLNGADAVINKGDFAAVTGASGIGKSTLMKLVLGVYMPTAGDIYFDTENGNVAADVSTRSLFSYVPQGNMLFSGTLRENVTFINTDASEEEINFALKISCVNGFLKDLPEGLETRVGENGVGLSEGQIQRVAIARAILCDAPIMLLDEATSALDAETEVRVLKNLKTLEGKTSIIISHRPAAFSICNKELHISHGKIEVKEL